MTLRAMRRERRPTRVLCPLLWIPRGVPGPRACDVAGTPSSFRHADYSFKSVRLSISSRGSYPPFVGFLSRRLPASSFVRSLTWSISAPTYSSASCWQLRYMSVSRRWNVAAARACHADHCEVWETTSSSFCVACSSYSTSQLRKVIAWRRPVRLCRSLRSGGGRIVRLSHRQSDPGEGAMPGAKMDKMPWVLVRPISSCGRRRPVPDIALAVEPVPRRSRRVCAV